MRFAFFLLSASTLTFTAGAAELTVNVPQGTSYIRAESFISTSGCGNSTSFYAVTRDKNSDFYRASVDLSVPDLETHLQKLREDRRPRVTCMAIVKVISAAAFLHYAEQAGSIQLAFPGNVERVSVTVTPVE